MRNLKSLSKRIYRSIQSVLDPILYHPLYNVIMLSLLAVMLTVGGIGSIYFKGYSDALEFCHVDYKSRTTFETKDYYVISGAVFPK
jgi:hypothetical protein